MASPLEAARDAFARGDFAETRRRAGAVLASDAPEGDKEAARELLGRISGDRTVFMLLAACLLFFAVVVFVYAGNGS